MRKDAAGHLFSLYLRLRQLAFIAAAACVILALGLGTSSHAAAPQGCDGDLVPPDTIAVPPPDLKVDRTCYVRGGTYKFSHVNIIAGGKLIFVEPPKESNKPSDKIGHDFWATSIIIENGGGIYAGVDVPGDKEMVGVAPYGTNLKTLTFHLYGADPRGADPTKVEGPGESCAPIQDTTKFADCGIPTTKPVGGKDDVWNSNGKAQITLPGGVTDYFYTYASFHGDDGVSPVTGQRGHFGYKVLALSYGGTLQLRGIKGTSGTAAADIKTLLKDPGELTAADNAVITNSGTDWVRLTAGGQKDSKELTLDRDVDWKEGDQIVLTPTDYFPDHAELLTVGPRQSGTPSNKITVTRTEDGKGLAYLHSSTMYNIGEKVGTEQSPFRKAIETADGAGATTFLDKAETRAAVALLSRSIRIVSEGDKVEETLDDATKGNVAKNIKANPNYMYGGHVVFRQGFQKLQIQGVEFKQLGQGGLLGRYPVHFHNARQVPQSTPNNPMDGTYVIDSSVNESMTRWFVLHSTLGVTLARNVGWKSIGHGYFLEDSTETDNKLYSNIGIFARASVQDKVAGQGPNPRNIPGLLDSRVFPTGLPLKYHSDSQYPSVFWITNGWNSFAGNMAAGAGTCGACYWIPSTANRDMMDVQPNGMSMGTKPMTWSGYSAIQSTAIRGGAGRSPIRLFYKNYCSTAMHSLNISDGSPCTLVMNDVIKAIPNPRAPDSPDTDPGRNKDGDAAESDMAKMYYPRYSGQRNPTVCDPSKPIDDADGGCARVDCEYGNPKWCAVSTFSHYTTSFNWSEANFSAVWLRAGWLLFDHGFISDVLGAGITEVSGGDYARSNVPIGYWALTSNSIFVGETQPSNPYAQSTMPGCTPEAPPNDKLCVNTRSSTAYLRGTANWMVAQRLYNIYDGPAYQDANAYLDIKISPCPNQATCYVDNTLGVRRAAAAYKDPVLAKGDAYLPNAAIGWKQPNGFYYPPAFHSQNLFFKNVDIRHYVIEPLTFPGTYVTNAPQFEKDYRGQSGLTNGFINFTDVDRQTELSDDDGTLTGLSGTISVNEDPYFRAPIQTAQCKSNLDVDPQYACAPQPKGDSRKSVPTAVTSPYDHITTVIYPGCAVQDLPGPAEAACDEKKATGVTWGRDCTNQHCYGVPVYREFLTSGGAANPREWERWVGGKCESLGEALKTMSPTAATYKQTLASFNDACRFAFIRMAGVNGWQRSVMTANNGKYYIDTTVSKETQLGSPDLTSDGTIRRINVFGKGQKYYVYFVFAKKDTKQTYQIYVGGDTKVEGIKVSPKGWPIKSGEIKPWAMPWKASVADGILTVEVDFNQVPKTDIDPANTTANASVLSETCKPTSFCSRDSSNACQCDETKLGVLASLDPRFKNVCTRICKEWAVKDLDCPADGCRGFSFTIADGFGTAQDQYRRPKPAPFPTDDKTSPWSTILFKPTTKTSAGDCQYDAKHVPGTTTPEENKCPVVE